MILIVLKVAMVVFLLWITIEDFKHRAVSIWLFILLFVLQLAHNTLFRPDWYLHSIVNIGFIVIQLILGMLYFSIKNGKLVNITTNLLGLGDILFFIWMATAFNTLNFVVFYFASLVIILILFGLIKFKSTTTIPLAGCQAMGVSILICFSFFNVDFLTDSSLLELTLLKWMDLV